MDLLRSLKTYTMALPDRRAVIEAELQAKGLEVETVEAIDKRGSPTPENWRVKPSDYGCALSWLKLLEIAYDKGDELFAVFEDDFVFRDDTLRNVPSLKEIEDLDFDVIYMTGHYTKGILRSEPRRMPRSPGLVQAVGIFTTPARIFRRQYAPILMDRLRRNMAEEGFGADGTDALLQRERLRTYAFEAHIGGQRVKDRRSWEPRVNDFRYRGASSYIVDNYEGDKSPDSAKLCLAINALASRRTAIAAVDCSMRTLALLADGVTETGGKVIAFNDEAEQRRLKEMPSDRLSRFEGYGALELRTKQEMADSGPLDTVFFETAKEGSLDNALPHFTVLKPALRKDSLVIMSAVGEGDGGKLNPFRPRRTHGSTGELAFFTPQ